MSHEIFIHAKVNISEIASELDEDRAFSLINNIDLAQANFEFTEKVITHLIKSNLKEIDDVEDYRMFQSIIMKALDNDYE